MNEQKISVRAGISDRLKARGFENDWKRQFSVYKESGLSILGKE